MTTKCACGGTLSADEDPHSIEHAVKIHQQQQEHRTWVALEQLRGGFATPAALAALERLQKNRRANVQKPLDNLRGGA